MEALQQLQQQQLVRHLVVLLQLRVAQSLAALRPLLNQALFCGGSTSTSSPFGGGGGGAATPFGGSSGTAASSPFGGSAATTVASPFGGAATATTPASGGSIFGGNVRF